MTQPQPARCGTHAGYRKHRRNNEPTCDECRRFKADYARERGYNRAKVRPTTQAVYVPKLLLAEMYLNAPIELQKRIDRALGQRRMDQLVELYDAQEMAA